MKLVKKSYSLDKKKKIYNFLGIKLKIRNYDNEISELKKQVCTMQTLLNFVVDITNIPKAKGNLRKSQMECFGLLKQIHNICEENNIIYWLNFGSLLGAVRHKGFIPWDDDVDLAMLREDYYKVIPLLKKHFNNTDYYVREGIQDHFQLRVERKDNNLIGLDIFPIDRYCSNELLTDKLNNEISLKIKKAISVLSNKIKEINSSDISLVRLHIKQIQDEIVLENKQVEKQEPILFHAIDYPYTRKFLCHNWNEVFPLSKLEFEGETFYVPNEVDLYLRKNIGEHYMDFPKSYNFDDLLKKISDGDF